MTTATRRIAKLNKRLRIIAGGSSASKTISILLWLIDYAQSHDNKMISVVSEFLPHLKKGAIRDFLNIMEQHKYFVPSRWNKTDNIYNFETGSKIEFFSADQSGKVRGPRRNVLFINEANNIDYETYTQLEIRTKDIIFLDFNPVSEFWAYTEIIGKIDCDFITLTYRDNEALEPSIVATIESRRANKMWFQVYGEGKLGEVEGRIYKDWAIVDDIPHEAKLQRYGLDFGYSNDPTAIPAVYFYNGGYVFDEVLYKHGMMNDQIAEVLLAQPVQALTKADSAEPKSIAEIARRGVMIVPAKKGKDSVNYGIQFIQQQRISVTKRSTNLIREYRNYMWEQDADGKFINTPIGFMNHLLDGVRYALDDSIENARIIEKPKFGQGQFILDQLQPKESYDSYY